MPAHFVPPTIPLIRQLLGKAILFGNKYLALKRLSNCLVLQFPGHTSKMFNMAKRFLILCLFFFCQLFVFAQDLRSLGINDRRLKINELKIKLSFLKDTAHINCLNLIARLYATSTWYKDYDSVDVFAQQAISESKKQDYENGICTGMYIIGFNKIRINPIEAEKYLREVNRLAGLLKNDSLVADSYLDLGASLWYQGKFQDAFEAQNNSIKLFETQGRLARVTEAYLQIINTSIGQGNYERAFEYSQKAYILIRKNNDQSNLLIYSLLLIETIYRSVGDYESARKYMQEASLYLKPDSMSRDWSTRNYFINLGDLYFDLGQIDSSLYCYLHAAQGYPTSSLYKDRIGRIYFAQKKYDSALSVLLPMLMEFKKTVGWQEPLQTFIELGEIYLYKKNYKTSLYYARRGLYFSKQAGARQNIRDSYKLLSSIYDTLKNTDSALAYYKKYIQIKESLITDQFKGRLFDFNRIAEDEKKMAQIELLKKEKLLSQQQLEQSRLFRNILIGGMLFLGLLGFIVFRNVSLKRKNERLKSEKIQSELQHKAIELEMQALRAQMNPHFIFNCLTSINSFILKNEADAASDYLTRFSRLIRLVLIHSQSSVILLKDEIEMLRLYLDMERLRFKNAFDYDITFSNSIDSETIYLPSLLLQPFCENAIWHGLMHKEGHGHLEIKMSMHDNILNCTITDDGIGRTRAAELKGKSREKQKSLGLKITTERLALINEEKGLKTNYEIEDVLDEKGNIAGTKVILSIRYKEQIKEPEKQFSHTV